jgi:hypothetical protein
MYPRSRKNNNKLGSAEICIFFSLSPERKIKKKSSFVPKNYLKESVCIEYIFATLCSIPSFETKTECSKRWNSFLRQRQKVKKNKHIKLAFFCFSLLLP